MQVSGTGKEIKAFVDSVIESVREYQDKSPDTCYSVDFGYVFQQQLKDASSSQVLSYLDKLKRGVSQFSDTDRLMVEINAPMTNRLQNEFVAGVEAKFRAKTQPEEKPELKAVDGGVGEPA